jgi:hypothetical protein
MGIFRYLFRCSPRPYLSASASFAILPQKSRVSAWDFWNNWMESPV